MNLQNNFKENKEKTRSIRMIRLFYVAMEKFRRYSTNEMCVGHTYGISSPFILPDGMTIEDASKVVSYLSEKVEKENNIEPCTEKSVAMVGDILEEYGFQKVDNIECGHFHSVDKYNPFRKIGSFLPVCQKVAGVVDLFTVNGDLKLFHNSYFDSRYFDWFTPGVSKQEVDAIYNNIGKGNLLESDESEIV